MKKVTQVTAKFLNQLADDIYNPKDKSFLPLCHGTLQNGVDPYSEKKRTMHCGLGELYYCMTGKQPEKDNVDETDVVDLVIDNSVLKTKRKIEAARKAVDDLDVDNSVKEDLLMVLDDSELDDTEVRALLDLIPEKNDENGNEDDEHTTKSMYRARSKRVAAVLRQVAELIE
jgi:hypothetical protein